MNSRWPTLSLAPALIIAGMLLLQDVAAQEGGRSSSSENVEAGQVNKVAEPIEWEVVFADDVTADEYARQLEYFKIEIAAISTDGRVEYISRLTDRKPLKHVGSRGDDPRRYLGWKSGRLHAVDRRLLGQAGINTNRKELTHYFPPDVQRVMEQLERAYGGRKPSEIRRTRFEIHPLPQDRYEFVVVEQDPPREPRGE